MLQSSIMLLTYEYINVILLMRRSFTVNKEHITKAFISSEEIERKIDEYRRQQNPIPNYSEAVRQLIIAGLAAKGHPPS